MRKITLLKRLLAGLLAAALCPALCGCAQKTPLELLSFVAADSFRLPGDILLEKEGCVVLAARLSTDEYGALRVQLPYDVKREDGSLTPPIYPFGCLQGYWFYWLPEQYAELDIFLGKQLNAQPELTGDVPQLDRSGLGQCVDAEAALGLTGPEAWQEKDWSEAVNLVVSGYDVVSGNLTAWDGMDYTEELPACSRSDTILLESLSNSGYRFDAAMTRLLLDGDPDATARALAFLRDPYSPGCILLADYVDIYGQYDVLVNGARVGEITKVDNTFVEISVLLPHQMLACTVKRGNALTFEPSEVSGQLRRLLELMQP